VVSKKTKEYNDAKAKLIYDVIDEDDFYICPVEKPVRSIMNLRFACKQAIDNKFLTEAAKNGIIQSERLPHNWWNKSFALQCTKYGKLPKISRFYERVSKTKQRKIKMLSVNERKSFSFCVLLLQGLK